LPTTHTRTGSHVEIDYGEPTPGYGGLRAAV